MKKSISILSIVIFLVSDISLGCGGSTVAQKYAGSEFSGGSRVQRSYGSKAYRGRKAYKQKKRVARGSGGW